MTRGKRYSSAWGIERNWDAASIWGYSLKTSLQLLTLKTKSVSRMKEFIKNEVGRSCFGTMPLLLSEGHTEDTDYDNASNDILSQYSQVIVSMSFHGTGHVSILPFAHPILRGFSCGKWTVHSTLYLSLGRSWICRYSSWLTLCRLNELSYTINRMVLISILGMSDYVI